MKRIFFCISLILFFQSSFSQHEENRIALLIGNSKYKDFPLVYPANDVRDLGRVLKDIGFKVIEFTDLSISEMKEQIREFGLKTANDSTTGFFFYSGHGFHVKGENFLVPYDVDIEKNQDLGRELFCVKDLMNAINSEKNKLNIIIFDVYFDNPYKYHIKFPSLLEDGLAFIEIPANTFMVYTAVPNQMPADKNYVNGLWVSEFIQTLKIPNLYVEEIIKSVRRNVINKSGRIQIPWYYSTLTRDIILNQK